jgi:hypothetical protein
MRQEELLSNHIQLHQHPRRELRDDEEEKMSPEDPEMAEAPVRGDSRATSKVIVIGSAHSLGDFMI